MKKNNLIYFVIIVAFIAVSFISLNNSKKNVINNKIINETNSNWTKITISNDDCKKFGIPELAFSILVPNDFKIQYNYRNISALRIYKTKDNEDKIETEISIGTSNFKEQYSLENEKKWLDEFKNFPQIKNNPDFSIEVNSGLQILKYHHNYYIMKMSNVSKKYPENIPLNTISITHPSVDGMKGIAIVISKFKINKDTLLSKIETDIINSLKFE